jgi:hypothetical protein
MSDDLVKRLREGATWDDDVAAADRIDELEVSLQAVLNREAATTARYDAKTDELEAKLAKAEKERDALKVTYDDIYADAMSDAESDAKDFEGDLWKGVRRLITELGFDWSGDVQYDGVPADEAVDFLSETINEAYSERERLALAICGGEDAPGYANAQTVETLEKVARDNANATIAQINRTLAVETKLAKAVASLETLEDASRFFGSDTQTDRESLRYAHETTRRLCRTTLAEIEGEKG